MTIEEIQNEVRGGAALLIDNAVETSRQSAAMAVMQLLYAAATIAQDMDMSEENFREGVEIAIGCSAADTAERVTLQ